MSQFVPLVLVVTCKSSDDFLKLILGDPSVPIFCYEANDKYHYCVFTPTDVVFVLHSVNKLTEADFTFPRQTQESANVAHVQKMKVVQLTDLVKELTGGE